MYRLAEGSVVLPTCDLLEGGWLSAADRGFSCVSVSWKGILAYMWHSRIVCEEVGLYSYGGLTFSLSSRSCGFECPIN